MIIVGPRRGGGLHHERTLCQVVKIRLHSPTNMDEKQNKNYLKKLI